MRKKTKVTKTRARPRLKIGQKDTNIWDGYKEHVETQLQEIRDQISINRNSLDDELIRQPDMLYRVGELYARVADARDAAKDTLKSTKAESADRARRRITEGGERATDARTEEQTLLDDAYKQALENYHVGELMVNRVTALRDAVAQRGYVLRDLVQLYQSEYFVKDSANTDARYTHNKAALARGRREQH